MLEQLLRAHLLLELTIILLDSNQGIGMLQEDLILSITKDIYILMQDWTNQLEHFIVLLSLISLERSLQPIMQ